MKKILLLALLTASCGGSSSDTVETIIEESSTTTQQETTTTQQETTTTQQETTTTVQPDAVLSNISNMNTRGVSPHIEIVDSSTLRIFLTLFSASPCLRKIIMLYYKFFFNRDNNKISRAHS